jgi:hypothetical protein
MAKKLTPAMVRETLTPEQAAEVVAKTAPAGSEVKDIDGRKALVKTKPNGDVEIHWLT